MKFLMEVVVIKTSLMALPKNLFAGIFIAILFIVQTSGQHALLFPSPTLLQLVVGVSVPSTLPNKTFSISVGHQMNFELPTNISQFNDGTYILEVVKRSINNNDILTRSKVYEYVEIILNRIGYDKQCLLKSICEMARNPLHIEDENFIENILYFLLMPSLNKNANDSENAYEQAEALGKYDVNCVSAFPLCEHSLLDTITKFV